MLQADGGTRTASITGAYVALHQALAKLVAAGDLPSLPLREPVAAISCGIVGDEAVLDLDYVEDSGAKADANFVLSASGGIVQVQVTAEERHRHSQARPWRLAFKGVADLVTSAAGLGTGY